LNTKESDVASVGYLEIIQRRDRTKLVRLGSVDALLLCASYDPRCLEITRCGQISARKALVFRFEAPSDDNRRTEHANALRGFAQSHASSVDVVPLPRSVDTAGVREALKATLAALNSAPSNPISVALDISTFPKSYFYQVIATGFSLGLFHRVVVFYSETGYTSGATPSTFKFTEGPWKSIQVPFLEGQIRAGAPRHSIVAVGADPASLERFIRRYEPDSMTLIAPIPGASTEIDTKVLLDTNAIRRKFGSAKIVQVPAFDAIGILSHLQSAIRKFGLSHEIGMFSLGTKPHALGMGIVALSEPTVPLVCRVPEMYVERQDAPNGWSWTYDMRDSSNPLVEAN
jgi:hypothetical protein